MDVKEITAGIKKVLKGMRNPDKRKDNGRALFEIFQWQVLEDAACAEQKRLWSELQGEGGPLLDDANLREEFKGSEALTLDTGHFAVSIKVAPRSAFNRDKFVAAVADEFNLTGRKLERLLALVEEAKEPGTPQLTKKVVTIVRPDKSAFAGLKVLKERA